MDGAAAESWMVFVGVAVGVSAALAAGRLLDAWVAGMQRAEPLTLFIMVSVLVAAALLASFVLGPAREQSRSSDGATAGVEGSTLGTSAGDHTHNPNRFAVAHATSWRIAHPEYPDYLRNSGFIGS
jgi:hypothetical protein